MRTLACALVVVGCGNAAPLPSHASAPAPAPAPVSAPARASAPASAPAPEPEPVAGPVVIRTASARYDFSLEGADPERPVTLTVLTKDGRALQRIELAHVEMTRDEHGGLLLNASELYEDQGTINVGDFNFDGREDFAVQDSHEGSYGGPTFRVFLHAADGERFTVSEPFSELTRHTLGMFQVDAARRRLVTYGKDGCCYHVTETLAVDAHGAPKPVERVIEDARNDSVVIETTQRLVGGKWQTTVRRTPRAP